MDTAQGMRERADVAKVNNAPCGGLGSRKGGSFLMVPFSAGGSLRRAGRGGGREHDGVRRGVREGGADGTGPHPPPRPGAKEAVTVIVRGRAKAEEDDGRCDLDQSSGVSGIPR